MPAYSAPAIALIMKPQPAVYQKRQNASPRGHCLLETSSGEEILTDMLADKAVILRDTNLLQLIRLVISSRVHLGIKRSRSFH